MRDVYYEDEKKDLKVDIFCFIFSALCLLALLITIRDYLEGHFGLDILLIMSLMSVLFAFLFFYFGWANIVNSNYNRRIAREIVEQGVKVSGVIFDIVTTENPNYKGALFKRASFFGGKSFGSDDRRIVYYHYAKVRYVYKNEVFVIDTPYLEFYPNDLVNYNVDVYVYGNKCYVSNYNIKTKDIKIRKKQWFNLQLLTVLLFFIMFVICGVLVYLRVKGKIGVEKMISLIIVCMIGYFVTALIAYLKYSNKKK